MPKQIYFYNVPSIFNKRVVRMRKLSELRSLFISSFSIKGMKRDENDYIFGQLFDKGKVAAARLNGGVLGFEDLCYTDFVIVRYSYLDRPLKVTLLPLHPLANINTAKWHEVGKDVSVMYITPSQLSIEYMLQDALDQYVEAMATLINNLNLNKMPLLGRIKNDSQGRIVKHIINGMIENRPFIMVPDDGNDIDVLPKNTGVPNITADMKRLENEFYNECLTILGIDNGSIAKKERVLQDEINANNAVINAFRGMYTERVEEWLEEINTLFGTKYELENKVEKSEAVIEAVKNPPEEVPQ